MKRIRCFMICTLLSLCATIQSKEVSIYSGDVMFDISDDYEEMAIPNNSSVGYCAKSEEKILALISYRKGDFDVTKVFENMDANLCDLSNYRLVDTETEHIWNLTTDYVLKKYESESGQKFASYTRYVTKGAYCFGFWYNTEDEYRDFEKLIESISFSEESGWGQIKLTLKYTGGIIYVFLVLLIIASFIAGVGGKVGYIWENVGISTFLTLIVALVFLIPLWHFWIAYAVLLSVFFVVCMLCSTFGFHLNFDAD